MVTEEGRVTKLQTRDISIGGMFLVSEDGMSPPVGTTVSIKFSPGSENVRHYTLTAKIQRLTDNGIVVTFIDFGLEDLQFINSLATNNP